MRVIRALIVIGLLVSLSGAIALEAYRAEAQDNDVAYRWDIFQFIDDEPFEAPFVGGEGGVAYAYAQDGTIIKLTGSGTFQLNNPTAVTGGGTWATFPSHGLRPTAEGTYTVSELISFAEAPGTTPDNIGDAIGERADARAGLAVMRIAYANADGSPAGDGILTVSSRLAKDSPASIFVGVSATMGYVAYWDRSEPVRGVNANRANFHVLPEGVASP